ncbi:FtsX-like permease family protein [Flammeovirga sp. SubArs3]|uniref:ABC transporter permease n=1 Tax=Flammeovirga sp. SubArs3 TaxID=2995316 RepID=UPI00248BEB2B|nr:FtsX-like permease family protein [Flammeovirga sp. SubArs3]
MKTIIYLSYKSIKYRRYTFLLSVLSIAVSITLLLSVLKLKHQVRESFVDGIHGIDLIVGARNSDISLLLYSIYHIGSPNNNVSEQYYQKLKSNKNTRWIAPFSMGDSHKGFPVIGTTYSYFIQLEKPDMVISDDLKSNHIIIGAKVANELGYKIGDQLILSHGNGEHSFIDHEHIHFRVSKILPLQGTHLDKSLFIGIKQMGEMHQQFHSQVFDPFDDTSIDQKKSYSGLILSVKEKNGLLELQRTINDDKVEALTAILPAVTVLELFEFIAPIEKALIMISIIVFIVAVIGLMTTVLTSLNERKKEMAILRSLGASHIQIFFLIVVETCGITLIGEVLGIVIYQCSILVLSPYITLKTGITLTHHFEWIEIVSLLLLFLTSIIFGFIPAYQNYKNSLHKNLIIAY